MDAAKARLVSTESQLAANTATSKPRSAACVNPIDRHSRVHPPVNAFGNQAITTADRPVKSDKR